jgi:glycoside/pentoside/hexuronide:cation symporter, GPH family
VLAWLPLSYATYKLFIPPADAGSLYLAVWSFVLFTAGTALFMPYTAMGAELSTDYHQRSRVFLYRHVFAAVGTLSAAVLFVVANHFSPSYFPERETLKLMAWVGIALLPIPVLFTAWKVRELPLPRRSAPVPISWRVGLGLMLANKPYLRILGSYFANGIANAFPLTLFFFFIRQVLERPDWAAVYLPVYFFAAIAGTPLWLFLANRYGKHIAWRVALLMAVAAFSLVPFLGAGDVVPFLFVTFVAGLTLGADLAMPAAMLADAVDHDSLETGQRRTGIYFAVWGMAAKFAAALVVGVSLEWLAFAGFVPNLANDAAVLRALSVMFGIFPIVFKLVALALVWNYALTARRQAALRAVLAARNTD